MSPWLAESLGGLYRGYSAIPGTLETPWPEDRVPQAGVVVYSCLQESFGFVLRSPVDPLSCAPHGNDVPRLSLLRDLLIRHDFYRHVRHTGLSRHTTWKRRRGKWLIKTVYITDAQRRAGELLE